MDAQLKEKSGFRVHVILSLAMLVAIVVLGGTYPGKGAPTSAAAANRPGIPVCGKEALQSGHVNGSGRMAETNGKERESVGRKGDSRAGGKESESAVDGCPGN
jgi:hypothetical protein